MAEAEHNDTTFDQLMMAVSTAVESREFAAAIQRMEEAIALNPDSPEIKKSHDNILQAINSDDVESLLEQAETHLVDAQLSKAYHIADSVLKTMDEDNQRALQVLDNCYELASETSILEQGTHTEAIDSPNQDLRTRLNELTELIGVAVKVRDYIHLGDLQSGKDYLLMDARQFSNRVTVRHLTKEINDLESQFQRLLKKGRTARRKKRPETALAALGELAELGLDERPAAQKLKKVIEGDLEKRERQRRKRKRKHDRAQSFKETSSPTSSADSEHGVLAEDTAIVSLKTELGELRKILAKQRRASGDQERMNRFFDEIEELVKTSRFAAARLKVDEVEASLDSPELMKRLQGLLEPCSKPGYLEWVVLPGEPESERLKVRLEYRNESAREVVVRDLLLKKDGLLVENHRNLGLKISAGDVLQDFPGCQSSELIRGRFPGWCLHEISLHAKIRLSTGEFRSASIRLPRNPHDEAICESR